MGRHFYFSIDKSNARSTMPKDMAFSVGESQKCRNLGTIDTAYVDSKERGRSIGVRIPCGNSRLG